MCGLFFVPNFAAMPKKPDPKIKPRPFANKPRFNEGPYNSTAWRKLRALVIQNNPICQQCGRQASNVCDHINPVRLGGSFWDVNNLQALCTSCHNKKSGQESKI